MPIKLGKALLYAVSLWLIGFIWGSVVFMTPSLKNVSAIPYVSRNPAISFPILIMWLVATYPISKSYLKSVDDKAGEGLKLGITFSIVNVALDLVILVLLLKAGWNYFASLTICFVISDAYSNSLGDGTLFTNASSPIKVLAPRNWPCARCSYYPHDH